MASLCARFWYLSTCAALAVAVLAYAFRTQTPLVSPTDGGDLIYCYDSITTLSNGSPRANCFSVSPSGTFSRVFAAAPSEAGADAITSSGAAIPGLWDGHGHLMQFGEWLQAVNLFGSSSLNEAVSRVDAYLAQHPDAGSATNWIRGAGWDQAAFGRMPTAADLDSHESLKGKYVMLERTDFHCAWVSNAVLKLLPDPLPTVPGGEIITNPGLGVFCDNAIDIVMSHFPKPTKAKRVGFVRSAMRELNKVGLVGIHDAGIIPEELELYHEMATSQDWTVRMYAMVECAKRNTFCPDSVWKGERDDGRLSIRSVKLFADGALGSWGSAMIEPFSDRPDFKGSLLVNGSTLTSLTQSWAEAGYQVNIHAIGDLANRLAIDAFENALSVPCPDESAQDCQSSRRFRIEHAQIVHPDDQRRMFAMGIVPSIQPTHATSDMEYADARLGEERVLHEAYRMRSFLDLMPVLGSDFPVEPPNPFQGMYAAVTRKNPGTGLGRGGSETGWHTEEALTMEQALKGFTLWPAKAAFMEHRAGVIQEGAFADWVVLDTPLESVPVESLRTLEVRETWVAGKKVYDRYES